MDRWPFLGLLSLFFSLSVASAAAVENFRLLDANGESHELYRHKKARAVVLMVHSLGCPIVEEAFATINQIAEEFKKQGVDFFMVNPRSIDTRSALQEQSSKFKNTIPILMDPAQVVARSLKFTRTAEVLVIDPETWTILYRGAIDDGAHGYGAARVEAKNEFLKQALTAVLADHLDKIPKSTATLGCLVNLDSGKVATYEKDVAPILMKKCMQCHDGRNPRAWRMSGFEAVKQWSPMIRETVMTRTMPPWWPDEKEGEYVDQAGSLTDREQTLLFNWIEAGSPRGKGRDPLVKFHPADKQPKPDLIAKLEHPVEVPAKGIREIDFVKLNLDTSKGDIYIRGIRAMEQLESYHHMAALLIPPGAEQSGSPGEALHASRDLRDLMYLDWVRRLDNSVIEPPYAFKVPKGYSVYLELHLLAIGRPVVFNPSFGVTLAKGDPKKNRILQHMTARKIDFKIPAGVANHQLSFETAPFENPTEIVALRPHMHLRSKSMRVTAVLADGGKKLLGSFPDLKPHWTRSYMFKKPVLLPAGAKLLIEGAYDNSAQNPFNPDPDHEVKFGPHYLRDEMFICHVYYWDEKSARSLDLDDKWKTEVPKKGDGSSSSM